MQTRTSIRRSRGAFRNIRKLPLAAAVVLAFAAPVWAQSATEQAPASKEAGKDKDTRTLGTVTVTAQKREENLQKVPISLQVLGNEQLEQQNVQSFNDYAKLIPSLSYGTAGGGVFSGPGFVQVYMRGVASGGDGNHSGSQPSVGMYLDEQPITTIQGALDIHMYDIDRVEALAGPQGTLYGASSQAGTVRIITKKPDPSGYAAGFAVEANAIDGGGIGHVLEGFVNLPINSGSAVRLVGWQKHDAGYVDNLHGTRKYPTSGIVADNANLAENNYNTADTAGFRGAARFDINDRWTITPQIIAQKQKAYGSAGIDPMVGSAAAGYDASTAGMAVKHFHPESSDDRWWQAALTVEGKIGNFDLTYVFSHLKRDVDSESDYSDYGYWYDALAGYGAYFYDNSGALVNPSQYIQATDGYTRTSHELRIASPQDNRFRVVAGLFWQQQEHQIHQRYRIDNLADSLSVSGWPDTIWLTQQERRDRDQAIFGQLSFDVTDKLELNAGGRWFTTRNSLKGYFGFANGYSSGSSLDPVNRYGEAGCYAQYGAKSNWVPFEGAPCVVVDKGVKENDAIYRLNATYKIDDDHTYATFAIDHNGASINRARFDEVTGSVHFDKAARSGAVDMTVHVKSVYSGSKGFDQHLLTADLFDAAKYPTMRFVSDRLVFEGDRLVEVPGQQQVTLVMRGRQGVHPIHQIEQIGQLGGPFRQFRGAQSLPVGMVIADDRRQMRQGRKLVQQFTALDAVKLRAFPIQFADQTTMYVGG